MFTIYDYEVDKRIAEIDTIEPAISFAEIYSRGTNHRPSENIWIYESFDEGTSSGERPIAFVSNGIVYNKTM